MIASPLVYSVEEKAGQKSLFTLLIEGIRTLDISSFFKGIHEDVAYLELTMENILVGVDCLPGKADGLLQ